MFSRSWIRDLFARAPRTVRKAPARRRPTLEALETRLVPAYLAATPMTGADNPWDGADIGEWSTPALGDVDGDGDLDALVGERDGTLNYFQNTGTATSPVYEEQTGASNPFHGIAFGASSSALGDVDGDGDLDALVGASDGTLRYFKNTGTATSPVYQQQQGADNPWDGIDIGNYSMPTLGDVDGDGDLDLVVGAGHGTLAYYQNTGTATGPVYVEQTGADNPWDSINVGGDATPALGDVDRDGDLDLVVGNSFDSTLRYFQNTGTASSPVYVEQTDAANPLGGIVIDIPSPALGDVDGDGDLDLLVGSEEGMLRYIRIDAVPPAVNCTVPTGVGNPWRGIATGGSSTAWGDIDGDGDLDLAVGTGDGTLRYYKNTGSATRPVYKQQRGAANPWRGINVGRGAATVLSDVDGDGDLDLVVGKSSGTLACYKNTGSATRPRYQPQRGAANPFRGIDVGRSATPALEDVDGDGDLDLVVGERAGTLRYYQNTGMANSPRYEQQQDADNPWDGIDVGGRSAPTLGDIDSDGDLDLVVGAADGMLAYYQNTGTATSPAYSQRTGSDNPWDGINLGGRSTPALEDVDGDGDLDLVGGGGRALVYCRTNRAVVLDRSLADQTFSGSGFHSFTVPADAFLDLEHDALHYLAALADGSALPEWLSFDPTTRTFRGNPEPGDVSPLQIRVTALDTDGPPLSDVFRLSLVDVTDLPPTIASNQEAVTVNQGSPASNSGTFGDAEGLSTVTLTASLGAVTRNDDGTWSWSYTPPVGTGGPSTVTITATDDGGLTATTTVTLTVN